MFLVFKGSAFRSPLCFSDSGIRVMTIFICFLNFQIFNNGKGIPVVHHKDENMYVPTMIFGHLLTSSNFNDEEEKVKIFSGFRKFPGHPV